MAGELPLPEPQPDSQAVPPSVPETRSATDRAAPPPVAALYARLAAALDDSARLADQDAERAERKERPERARLEQQLAARARGAAQRARRRASEKQGAAP
jgi:hypothetical protein